VLNYRLFNGRGSLNITATSNVNAAGIIAFNATALPTPMAKSEAVIMGEMTVATDWDVVVRPRAVPVLPLQISTMSACMIGKIELLKKPMMIATESARNGFDIAKKREYDNSTARAINVSILFLLQTSDVPPKMSLPTPPEMETTAEKRAEDSIPKCKTLKK
jgi:hypothetical protein